MKKNMKISLTLVIFSCLFNTEILTGFLASYVGSTDHTEVLYPIKIMWVMSGVAFHDVNYEKVIYVLLVS